MIFTHNAISILADQLLKAKKRQKSPLGIFITGTDTAIGKTALTCALLREFRSHGISAAGFKPICCGDRADARKLWNLADRKIPLNTINPIHLPRPLAPIAQKCPPWSLLIKRIQQAFEDYHSYGVEIILVEGAGGILCPITRKHTMRELAQTLNLDLLIVTPDRLGVLNQTLLVLAAASQKKLSCKGIVLNRLSKHHNTSILNNATILGQIVKLPIFQVTSSCMMKK